ncbi:MAG: hypothetical protein ABR572_01805 [Cryomorphaceae bacterium]
MRSFLIKLLILTAANVLGAYVSANYFLDAQVPFSYWLSLAFIAVLTYIVHKQLIAANEKRAQLFVAYFMGALTVKLFLSVILLIVIGLVAREELAFAAVGYMIAYVLFTVAEIRDLLPRMKNPMKSDETP